MRTKTIICLYGGPGSGKSTMAAGLFYKLKGLGYNSEMIREYIKDWVWEGRSVKAGDQTYLFAKSARKERILIENKLDFIITDSPLILTHFYGLKYDWLERECNTSAIMLEHHHIFCKKHGYKVEHFYVQRAKDYNCAGRYQTEEEAKLFDEEIQALLTRMNIRFNTTKSLDEILNLLPRGE